MRQQRSHEADTDRSLAEGKRTDEDIFRDLKARRERGLRSLLRKYGERVKRTMMKGLSERSDLIDDAVNEAAHELWQGVENFKPEAGSLGDYFYGIVRNVVRKTLRYEALQRERLLGGFTPSPSESSEASPEQSKRITDLRKCISKLGPLQRAIVLADMQYVNSAPAGPIANEFKTTTNSVYVSRGKAYTKLRDYLKLN